MMVPIIQVATHTTIKELHPTPHHFITLRRTWRTLVVQAVLCRVHTSVASIAPAHMVAVALIRVGRPAPAIEPCAAKTSRTSQPQRPAVMAWTACEALRCDMQLRRTTVCADRTRILGTVLSRRTAVVTRRTNCRRHFARQTEVTRRTSTALRLASYILITPYIRSKTYLLRL